MITILKTAMLQNTNNAADTPNYFRRPTLSKPKILATIRYTKRIILRI